MCTERISDATLLHIVIRDENKCIDNDMFSKFLNHPNLIVDKKAIMQGFKHLKIEKLPLLLQHKDITLSIVKQNIQEIEQSMKPKHSNCPRNFYGISPVKLRFFWIIFKNSIVLKILQRIPKHRIIFYCMCNPKNIIGGSFYRIYKLINFSV